MVIYVVENPEYYYDSLISVAVLAESPEQALALAKGEDGWNGTDSLVVKEVDMTTPGVFHTSMRYG